MKKLNQEWDVIEMRSSSMKESVTKINFMQLAVCKYSLLVLRQQQKPSKQVYPLSRGLHNQQEFLRLSFRKKVDQASIPLGIGGYEW